MQHTEVALVPAGKYYRGDGKAATLITLTQSLWVGKYEMTQHQYAAVMGTNPSHFARQGIVGVVGRVDPASDDFEKNLRCFAANPLFRRIRINHNELKAGLKGSIVERCNLVADLGLTLDVNGGPDMPADVALLAQKLLKLRIVINYAANLRIDTKESPRAWREGMGTAPKCPNVYCKVSALVEQTGQKNAPREVQYYQPVLDALWEMFGDDRLVYGSNWPVSSRSAPYEVVVSIPRAYFPAKDEKAAAKFFLGNSQAAYGWRKR